MILVQETNGGSVDEKSLFIKFWTHEAETMRAVFARIPDGSTYKPVVP